MILLNYTFHTVRLLKFSDNCLFQLCVRVEVSEKECGGEGGRRGQLEKQTFEVQKAAPFCVPQRPEEGEPLLQHQKACVISSQLHLNLLLWL